MILQKASDITCSKKPTPLGVGSYRACYTQKKEKQAEAATPKTISAKPGQRSERAEEHRKSALAYLRSIGIGVPEEDFPEGVSQDRLKRNYETAREAGILPTIRSDWRILSLPGNELQRYISDVKKEEKKLKAKARKEKVGNDAVHVKLSPEAVLAKVPEESSGRLRRLGYDPDVAARIILGMRRFRGEAYVPTEYARKNSGVNGKEFSRHYEAMLSAGVFTLKKQGQTVSINPHIADEENNEWIEFARAVLRGADSLSQVRIHIYLRTK